MEDLSTLSWHSCDRGGGGGGGADTKVYLCVKLRSGGRPEGEIGYPTLHRGNARGYCQISGYDGVSDGVSPFEIDALLR